jgi:predicted PurR-regulated permease PerM
MEIFIPGFTALLLLALFLFLVMPRLGTPILAILSLFLLAYAVNNHMQMFYSEYRYSTWQDALKPYAAFIIIGLVFFLILGYVLYLFGIGAGNSLPVTNTTAITNVFSATRANNSSKGIVGSVVNTVSNAATGVANAASGVVTGVTNAASGVATGATNVVKNVSTNLGNMLSTPKTMYNNRSYGNNRY